MDYGRFKRAIEAQYIETIEDKREMFNKNEIKAKDLSQSVWAEITEHDRLLMEMDDDGE